MGLQFSTNDRIILSNENNVKIRENERTGGEEVVALEVIVETEVVEDVEDVEDVEVVLELDLEGSGDRIPERMLGIKAAVVGVFLGVGGVLGVGVSKKIKETI